jgi:hypothetical protein
MGRSISRERLSSFARRGGSTDVKGEIVNKLSARILELIGKIENCISQEIEVLHDPSAKVPCCEVSPEGVRIFLPNLDCFDKYLFLHELLHIERYTLESIPQVVALGSGDSIVLADHVIESRRDIVSRSKMHLNI